MLIGGFYSVDGGLLCSSAAEEELRLRFDTEGNYRRKLYTNNGRTASVYALLHGKERLRGKKILLPDYLCLSVISAVESAEMPYDFYRVKSNLEIDMEDLEKKIDEQTGLLYVTHYFSLPQPREAVEQIKALAAERGLLIMEDITQALFNADEDRMGFGDYIVASTRKWFPMTDGGLLAIRNGVEGEDLTLASGYDESVYKELLISNIRAYYAAHPQADKQRYLEYEKAANAGRYKDLTPREMTEASRSILLKTDKEELICRRRENYHVLYQRLREIDGVALLRGDVDEAGLCVPFGLTLLTENRAELYSYLVERNIIPEIQWVLPKEYYVPGRDAEYLSDHNLMLQCDQRYGAEEMNYTADVIEEYFRSR